LDGVQVRQGAAEQQKVAQFVGATVKQRMGSSGDDEGRLVWVFASNVVSGKNMIRKLVEPVKYWQKSRSMLS
jgi:hypothetical protein